MGDFKGKINWYNSQKKYGYVTDGYGNEYFFHRDGIKSGRKIVIQGFESEDEVEFDLTEDDRGKHAVNLTLTKQAPTPKKGEKKKNKKKEDKGEENTVMKEALDKAGITPETMAEAPVEEVKAEPVTDNHDTGNSIPVD